MTFDIRNLLMHLLTYGRRHISGWCCFAMCVFIFHFFFQTSYGQCMLTGLDMETRLVQSEATLIGTLTKSRTFFKADGNIYTAYLVINGGDTTMVEKMGGTVGDLTQVIEPDATIGEGDVGILFVNKSDDGGRWTLACGPYSFVKYDATIHAYIDGVGQYDVAYMHKVMWHLADQLKSIEYSDATASRMIPPTITDISPDTVTAGTETVLTITGFNFGSNATGQSAIELRNPDVGVLITAYQPVPPNHILSWSDKKIQLIVPGRDPLAGHAGAGSGVFRMKNNIGELGYSPALTVLYNRFIQGANQQMHLVNDNDKGGYTMTFNTAFKANGDAALAYQKALETWQCENKSNITLADNTTSKNCPANDGINLVAFDDGCALSTGVLAQTTHWFITCSDGQSFFLEMDMIFDKQAKWSYTETNSDATKFDFQSTALHELGHLHGIGHSLEAGSTMFPNVFPGTTRHTIDKLTEEVAGLITKDSEAAINTCSIARYKAGPSCADTCKLQLTSIGMGPCINGLVTYTLNLINENTGSTFDVFIDGKLQSSMNYDASGIQIFSIAVAGDAQSHTVTIIDKANVECTASIVFTGVDCSCKIDATWTTDGNCVGDSIVYSVNITNATNASQDYTIFVDDVPYLTTSYSSNNVKVAVIADGAAHTIKVIDAIDVLCNKSTTVVTPMCWCHIEAELSFEACKDGKASYQLLLNHQNTGSAYQIYLDDVPIGGAMPYNNTSPTIALIELPSDASGIFKVVDVDKTSCRVEESIATQDCLCSASIVVDDIAPCENDSVLVRATLTIQNAFSGVYLLIANDIFVDKIVVIGNDFGPYSFKFKQPADGSMGNVLRLVGKDSSVCKATAIYDVPLCQCTNELKLLPLNDCDAVGMTQVQATLYHQGNRATTFVVFVNGASTTYDYANGDSTKFLLQLPGDGASYTIKVVDSMDTTCIDVQTITTYNCACGLVASVAESGPCNDDGTQTIYINMANNIKPAFVDVYIDGKKSNAQPLSTEVYASLSYPLQLIADGKARTIKIQDNEDTACVSTLVLETYDCSCFDVSGIAQVQFCDTSGFTVWSINISRLTQALDITIDGQYYKTISANEQSNALLLPLKGDGLIHTVNLVLKDGRCKQTLFLLAELCTCFSTFYVSAGDCGLDGKVPLIVDCGKSDYTTKAYLYQDGKYLQSVALSPTSTTTISVDVLGDSSQHIFQLISAGGNCAINDTLYAPVCTCRIDVNLSKIRFCDIEKNDVFTINLASTHFLADSFIVWLDDKIYSTFKHNTVESIDTLKILSDGRTHNIRITNPSMSCIYSNTIMISLCPCSMTLIASLTQPCINESESIVYCDVYSLGGVGKEYEVFLDDVYVKNLAYDAIGLDTFSLKVMPDGRSHNIFVRDVVDFNCSAQAQIFSPLCLTDSCSLRFIEIKATPCNDNKTKLHITFFAKYIPGKSYFFTINKVLSSSNVNYDPSGINVLDFTVPCGELHILINEGLDGSCGIDTIISILPHDGKFYYYPNPVQINKTLYLDNIDSTDFDKLLPLRFYDTVGREVASYDVLGKSKIAVSLDRLPDIDGLYFFTLGSKRKYKGKLVIIH